MLFRYKAIKNGKVVTGSLEAQTEQEASLFLKKNNYFLINLSQKSASTSITFFQKVSFNDIVNFTRQLAIMLNAGLTLIDSLDILKKQTTKPPMLKLLTSIDKHVREGNTFSEALKQYPHLFPNLYIALVKSGEASGKLSDILLRLSETLEKQREFSGKIKGALIYPLIVVIGMIIVMFVMVTFVVPKLLILYNDFDAELPLPTQILIFISNFSSKFWPLIILVVAGIVFGVRSYFNTPYGRRQKDILLLKLPLFSEVIKMSVLVDSTRTLALLIGSGISILDALQIIIETTGNVIYQQSFKNVTIQIEKGTSLGQALKNEEVFPPILVQMTLVGEQTGKIDDTLMRISKYFEMESQLAVKALTTLIEPLVLVFLGVGVGFLVISIITPIYNLTSSIQ